MVPLGPLIGVDIGGFSMGDVVAAVLRRFSPILALMVGLGLGVAVFLRVRGTIRSLGGPRGVEDVGGSAAASGYRAGVGVGESVRDRVARGRYSEDDGMLTEY